MLLRLALIPNVPPTRRRPMAMLSDLKFAVRSLRSTPAFTVVALIVLMLGIGATTAIYLDRGRRGASRHAVRRRPIA